MVLVCFSGQRFVKRLDESSLLYFSGKEFSGLELELVRGLSALNLLWNKVESGLSVEEEPS